MLGPLRRKSAQIAADSFSESDADLVDTRRSAPVAPPHGGRSRRRHGLLEVGGRLAGQTAEWRKGCKDRG